MLPWRACFSFSPFVFESCMDPGRDKQQCTSGSRRIRLFMYEDTGWGTTDSTSCKSEAQGLYIFLSGLALLAGIFLIGFDLIVGIKQGGELPPRASQRYRESHMHYNTSNSSAAPDLAQREYWL